MFGEGERAGERIGFEHRDAVMTAIGAVNKTSRRVDRDFGGRVVSGEGCWQGCDCLQGGKQAFGGIERECCYRVRQFIDHVGMAVIRVNRQMSRTAAGSECRFAGGCERAGGGIHAAGVNCIGSQVGGEGEATVGREIDRVRVGLFLAGRMNAAAFVPYDTRRYRDTAVRAHRQHGHRAFAVVGDKNVFAIRTDAEVARSASAGNRLVDRGEHAGLRIKGECQHRATGLALILCTCALRCGVEVGAIGSEGQK